MQLFKKSLVIGIFVIAFKINCLRSFIYLYYLIHNDVQENIKCYFICQMENTKLITFFF